MSNYCKVKYCRFQKFHVTSAHRCGKCHQFGHGMIECGNPNKILELKNNSKFDKLNQQDFCTVINCKHKWSHKTESHECKICGKRDHSSIDCNLNKINNIKLECPICRKNNIISKKKNSIYGITEVCKVCTINPINIIMPECKHAVLCFDCCKIIGNQHDLKEIIITEDFLSNDIINQSKNKFSKFPDIENPYTNIYIGMGCQIFVRKNINNSEIRGFNMHVIDVETMVPIQIDPQFLNEFIKNYIRSNCSFF